MTTLSEIVNIREEVLDKKFDLGAWYRYDPEQKENLVFLSPTVLLEDLELRHCLHGRGFICNRIGFDAVTPFVYTAPVEFVIRTGTF